MAIVIKKRVSLEFLGDEYKDAQLVFQSIPVKDLDELMKTVKEAEEKKTSHVVLVDILKKYFVEGTFPGMDAVNKEDLDGLDQETVIKCFSELTGQNLDPKSEAPSKSISSTEPQPQSKS